MSSRVAESRVPRGEAAATIPADALHIALSFLDERGLRAATCVCRDWRDAVYEPTMRESRLWRQLFLRQWAELAGGGLAVSAALVGRAAPREYQRRLSELDRRVQLDPASPVGFRELFFHVVRAPSAVDVELLDLGAGSAHRMALPPREADADALLRDVPLSVAYVGGDRGFGSDRCVRADEPFAWFDPESPHRMHAFATLTAVAPAAEEMPRRAPRGDGADGAADDDGGDAPPLLARLTTSAYFEVAVARHAAAAAAAAGRLRSLAEVAAEEGAGAAEADCVSVGLARAHFPLQGRQPGWDARSYGYHGDDGNRYHSSGSGADYGPRFGPGDVVGCLLDFTTGELSFTLNGRWLGVAFRCCGPGALFPVVGVDSPAPVTLNFGLRPFAFDVRAFDARRGAAARVGRGVFARAGCEPPAADVLSGAHAEEAVPERRSLRALRALDHLLSRELSVNLRSLGAVLDGGLSMLRETMGLIDAFDGVRAAAVARAHALAQARAAPASEEAAAEAVAVAEASAEDAAAAAAQRAETELLGEAGEAGARDPADVHDIIELAHGARVRGLVRLGGGDEEAEEDVEEEDEEEEEDGGGGGRGWRPYFGNRFAWVARVRALRPADLFEALRQRVRARAGIALAAPPPLRADAGAGSGGGARARGERATQSESPDAAVRRREEEEEEEEKEEAEQVEEAEEESEAAAEAAANSHALRRFYGGEMNVEDDDDGEWVEDEEDGEEDDDEEDENDDDDDDDDDAPGAWPFDLTGRELLLFRLLDALKRRQAARRSTMRDAAVQTDAESALAWGTARSAPRGGGGGVGVPPSPAASPSPAGGDWKGGEGWGEADAFDGILDTLPAPCRDAATDALLSPASAPLAAAAAPPPPPPLDIAPPRSPAKSRPAPEPAPAPPPRRARDAAAAARGAK